MKGIPLSLQTLCSHPPPSCRTLPREESPGIPNQPHAEAYRSPRTRAWRSRRRAPVSLRGRSPGTAGPDAGTCRGPPRPEAARFLPGGATAPEQLRWRRRLRAGGPGCSARAAASSRSPFPAAQSKGKQAAPGLAPVAGTAGTAAGRVVPAAVPQGGREGCAGRGARPRGPDAAPACPCPPVGLGRRVAAAGLTPEPGRRGGRVPRDHWPRRAAKGPTPAPRQRWRARSLLGTSPGERLAGEGPGVTEAPIFSWAWGPPGGRRITASSAGGQREPVSGGVPGPELGHAYAMLEFQFSLSLRILREPALAPFPVLPPTAVCVSPGRGGGRLGLGKRHEGSLEKCGPPSSRGKLSLPLPEGCVFLSDSPSPFRFPTMRFLALGSSAENQTGPLEKSFGNQTPGVGCAAPHVCREGVCVHQRRGAPSAGSGILTSSSSSLIRFKSGLFNFRHSVSREEGGIEIRIWACIREGFHNRHVHMHCLKS